MASSINSNPQGFKHSYMKDGVLFTVESPGRLMGEPKPFNSAKATIHCGIFSITADTAPNKGSLKELKELQVNRLPPSKVTQTAASTLAMNTTTVTKTALSHR